MGEVAAERRNSRARVSDVGGAGHSTARSLVVAGGEGAGVGILRFGIGAWGVAVNVRPGIEVGRKSAAEGIRRGFARGLCMRRG